MQITLKDGSKRHIEIRNFAALEGWAIQEDYVRFLSSENRDFRKKFTLEVLSYVTVVLESGQELPLSTDALIDNHLGTAQNLKLVFEEVLSRNGIDPKAEAEKATYWEKVGEQLAIAFFAASTKLIGPALELAQSRSTSAADNSQSA